MKTSRLSLTPGLFIADEVHPSYRNVGDWTPVVVVCKCKAIMTIHVETDDLVAWQNGELAQEAFPYLTHDEREGLISQTCADCWEDMFGA